MYIQRMSKPGKPANGTKMYQGIYDVFTMLAASGVWRCRFHQAGLNHPEPTGCRDSYCTYCTVQSAESKSFLKDEQHPIPTCNDTSFQLRQLLVNVFCLSVARVEWIESNRVSILHNIPGWPRHCLSSLVLCRSSIVFLELFPQFTH